MDRKQLKRRLQAIEQLTTMTHAQMGVKAIVEAILKDIDEEDRAASSYYSDPGDEG